MKRFDAEAIKARLLDRMRVKLNWALLSENGVISAIMDTFADSEAELARYAEYLLGEKKWTTAQNVSSLNSQVGLIGRKSHRMRSAISYVIVSHSDESGANRLSNFGRTFFNLDDRSNYDNITKDPDPQDTFRSLALVPWTYDTPYVIPRGTRFISASGVEFVSTEAVAIRALKEPYDVILNSTARYQAFLDAGGWNGIKYLKVPVIQGQIKTATLGIASGERFESMLLNVQNCEDASNNISRTFLKLFVNTTTDPNAKEEWVQASNILLANPLDKVYEVTNMPDYSGVIFKAGDGITGQRFPAGATISCEYLETAGEEGNIDKKYQITTISFPSGYQMIDPRTNTASSFLAVTNASPILGGMSAESEEDLRNYAPIDYLKYYAIATTDAYENQIKQYAQIGLDKVKVFGGTTQDLLSLLDADGNAVVTSTSQSVLYVTAISSNGEIIENAQDTLITPVAKAIGDLKAPSDTLTYIDPNFIRLRLNTIVYSDSTDQSDEDIKNIEKAALSSEYSIFNTNFKQPFHMSEFTTLTHSFSFVNHTDTFIEAVANTPFTDSNITLIPSQSDAVTTYPALYKFGFSFDSIFGSTEYYQGFQNYKQSAPYLLRIDLKFINDPAKAARKNRTFFVFDDRNLYDPTEDGAPLQSALALEAAKYFDRAGRRIVTNRATFTKWVRPEETLEDFPQRAARIAQFPYISQITDAKTVVSRVRDFAKDPFEIRPYIVDSTGKNYIFKVDEVTWPSNEEDPRVLLPGGQQCYKRDWRYVDYFDVVFNENYENPDSIDFARGYLTIPASFFEFTNIDVTNKEQFLGTLRNFVSIKVYAHPLLTDLEPENWNEIIFAEDEDIVVERSRTSQL